MTMSNDRRLTAVRNREQWPLTAGERARLNAHLVRGGVKVARGKSPAAAERAMDAVWAEAEERIAAEIAAAEKVRQEQIRAKAEAKAKRRAESIWW
jgi:RNA polymerase-interacting CarD/CdnL/TRCF family regulator